MLALCLPLHGLAQPADPARPAPSPASSDLTWIAGELPPFAWVGAQGAQGLAYDLAAQMRAKLKRSGDTSFYPWARAVRMAQAGPAYGVFPLARTPDREALFQWLIPLTTVHYSFFTRAEDRWDIHDPQLLKSKRIGVLRGSPIIKNLQAEQFSAVAEAKDYKDLLRLLERQHIDAIYAGEPMLRTAIEEFGFKPTAFRRGLSLKSAELYMAASLQVDSLEAERWLRAYRELEAEGAVARLHRKYLNPDKRER